MGWRLEGFWGYGVIVSEGSEDVQYCQMTIFFDAEYCAEWYKMVTNDECFRVGRALYSESVARLVL